MNAFQNVSHFPSSFFLKKKREREKEREMVTEKKMFPARFRIRRARAVAPFVFCFFLLKKNNKKKARAVPGTATSGGGSRRKDTCQRPASSVERLRADTAGDNGIGPGKKTGSHTHKHTHTHTHTVLKK